MQRRDVPKVLLAALAGSESTAAPAPGTDSTNSLQNALRARGAVRIPIGDHTITGKLQTLVQNDISGESRHDSVLRPSGFADYVLEVGNGKPGPNAGRIARLRIYGAAGNLGCLHMNTLSHMWRLNDLIFAGGPCPALVVEGCWDSNYTNIDILGHGSRGNDPAQTAAVIFRNNCNNIYCRGLRIEGALSGGIYTDGGPIYVVSGKIDDGFGGPQSAAAITVAPTGYLVLDDFYCGGMLDHFHIDVAGTLKLGKVALDGGSRSPACINDRRAWTHINAATHPSYSASSGGPFIPGLDLGEAEFRRYHPSVETQTPAAVYSRIHPIRQVRNLAVLANDTERGNTLTVETSLRAAHHDLYKYSFLVHNTTGTRRKILGSTSGGRLTLEGIEPVVRDADWSIEYCESHDTPIRHANAWLDRGQTLFAVVANPVTISASAYISDAADVAYGTTRIKITGRSVAPGRDFKGLFLVDNLTEEAYYIDYGQDAQGYIGVIYDRRAALDMSHEFSITAGHVARRVDGHAGLTRLVVTSAPLAPDLSQGTQFEIHATSTTPLTISRPTGSRPFPGQRITLTLVNTADGRLREVTWRECYKLAEWVNPGPGHSRSIDFRYDGANWVEVARTPTDVPN